MFWILLVNGNQEVLLLNGKRILPLLIVSPGNSSNLNRFTFLSCFNNYDISENNSFQQCFPFLLWLCLYLTHQM